MEKDLVALDDVHFSYHEEEEILKGISFKVSHKEMLGIIGPNGGGKSTLLKIITGLLTPQSGDISINSKRVSYVPQTSKLNTVFPLTVKEYLNLGHKNGISEIISALDFVRMKDHQNTLVRELSGGQKQRVQLAKALIERPEVLILDEPTNGLDGDGQDQLLTLIENVKNDLSAAVIIVDHNINQVLKYADKVLCLNRSYHWHNKKELIQKEDIESVYHCELEHIKIHENIGPHAPHHRCSKDHNEKKD